MEKNKRSFLSDIIGRRLYDEYKQMAVAVSVMGLLGLLIIYGLSLCFYWEIICDFLVWFSGTSILFMLYIAALILTLDFEVNVDENSKKYPLKYIFTIVWFIFLVALGIYAISYSRKYRKEYAFDCKYHLVDTHNKIYHFDWYDECELANKTEGLIKVKGHQIDDSYSFCEYCEEYWEFLDEEYGNDTYSKR